MHKKIWASLIYLPMIEKEIINGSFNVAHRSQYKTLNFDYQVHIFENGQQKRIV